MKLKTVFLIFLAVSALLFSCGSSALDKTYNHETWEEDLNTFAEAGVIDTNQHKVIVGYLILAGFSEEMEPEGKTYRQILKEGEKVFKKEGGAKIEIGL